MARYGMVINLALCMRCRACMVACKTEHQISTGKHGGHEYYRIGALSYEEGKYPNTRRTFTLNICMQCQTAPCIDVCPIPGAIYRRVDGIIALNQDKCNGCKRCMEVCPYNALYFDEENHKVDKCDFCVERISQGLAPACVAACMGRALTFGDLDDLQSDVSKLMERDDLKPDRPLFPPYFSRTFKHSVYYIETKGRNE